MGFFGSGGEIHTVFDEESEYEVKTFNSFTQISKENHAEEHSDSAIDSPSMG